MELSAKNFFLPLSPIEKGIRLNSGAVPAAVSLVDLFCNFSHFSRKGIGKAADREGEPEDLTIDNFDERTSGIKFWESFA